MESTIDISPAAKSLIAAIEKCAGRFIRASFQSTVKPAAAHKGKILIKSTVGVFRSGIDYANLASVKDGIESGVRGEVEPLPWGQWALFPWIITHNGAEYVRLYPVPGQVPQVAYSINSEPCDKATFQACLTPSQCAEKDAPACITKKLAEIDLLGCWTPPTEETQEGECCQ